jgi:iron complex outermembrane receptor protein
MIRTLHLATALAGVVASPSAALIAQGTPPASTPAPGGSETPVVDDEETILVTGQRPVGSVVGDIPAEQVLNPADVRAYGVNSISDLLDQLSPQTGSNQGRGGGAPAVLLNGKRISSFAEIRDIPTEAILRVEVMPEEVALKYGFSSDQKVVNFVLRRRFDAKTVVADGSTSTEGGGEGGTLEGGKIQIRGDNRFILNARIQGSARLTESDRDLISTSAGAPYSRVGNVVAARGGEIDPRLSALAGTPVLIAGVPLSAATGTPSLGAFAATANNQTNTDISPYRTLRPETETLTINSVYARAFGDISATANGLLTVTRSKALNGLPATALSLPAANPYSPFASAVLVDRYLGTDPLSQRTNGWTGHFGGGANGQFSQAWRWTATGNYDHGDSKTRTETGLDTTAIESRLTANDPALNPYSDLDPFVGGLLVNRAHSITNAGDLQLVTRGSLAKLPAGAIGTTITVGGAFQAIDANSLRAGISQDTSLSRTAGNGKVSIDVPIASRRAGVLSALGNLTANANFAVNRFSDFGTLTVYGAGLNWTPRPPLTLIASYTADEGAPTVQQLGNPVIVTPAARVFDYRRGQSVDVTAITGGNPNLLADDRRVVKIGATWKPLTKTDLSLTANYVKSRIRNAINALPEPTAAIESAFPDRFLRDSDGNLIRADMRSVNFSREDTESLRWGFNLSIPLKPTASQIAAFRKLAAQRGFPAPGGPGGPGGGAGAGGPPPEGAPPPPGAAPAGERASTGESANSAQRGVGGGAGPGGGGGAGGGRGPGGGGFGGPRGGGQAGGRVQVALYHTWHFQDEVLIRPGLPVLDRLNGDATGSAGGSPRHELEGQLGYSNAGLGVRLSANWQSPTTARAATGSAIGDLRFSDLTTFDLRVFADLGQMPAFIGKGWARNVRLTFGVTNIFNERQTVRDGTGDTPIRYQPAYLDPLGPSVRIGIRKLFALMPPRGPFQARPRS